MPAVSPSGGVPNVPPLGGTNEVSDLISYFQNYQAINPVDKIFTNEVYSLIKDCTTVEEIHQDLSNYILQPQPQYPNQDIYLYFAEQYSATGSMTNDDLSSIAQDVDAICQHYGDGWTMPVPNMTYIDAFAGLLYFQIEGSSGPLQALIQAVLSGLPEVGSSDDGGAENMITTIITDPNFLTKYPGVSLSDIQGNIVDLWNFGANSVYKFPDFASLYFTMLAKNSPDILEQGLVQEMRATWSTGSLQALQQWFLGQLSNPQVLNSGITISEIEADAQEIGFTLPTAFTTYFQAFATLMQSVGHNTPDYAMLLDVQSQWISALFANPGGWNAQGWFDTTFGTPGQPYPAGVADLYIRYPGALQSTIQSLAGLFVPNAASYVPTSFDNACRAIYAAHGPETSGFWHDLYIAYAQAGSNDAHQALEQWIDNVALSAFSQYPEMTVSDVMNFLAGYPFNIAANGTSPICDYVTAYIQLIWENQPGRTPDEIKFGNQVIAQILSVESGFSSFQDFKTFIDAQIPRYLKQWPNIPPATITGLFQLFGL